MEFSVFQNNIFDAVSKTDDNLMIEAVAGSGKSTTLEYLVKRIPDDATIRIVAFNKDIVEALRPKIHHPFATVSTLNSFGNQIISQNMGRVTLDKNKTDLILQEFVTKNEYFKVKSCVSRMVEILRATLSDPKNVNELADDYGIELPDGAEAVINKVYHECLNEKTLIDFRDQVFFPIHYNLPIPKYDFVLVDEVQDLDANQAELVIRSARRLVMVGDSRQAIYGFRGSMASAMQKLRERTSSVSLPLSVSYRCPRSIVVEAKKIVPQIEACDWASEGEIKSINLIEFRKEVLPKDMIICRTIVPLVTECFALIREGRKAMVKGRDIGEQLIGLISKFKSSSIEKLISDLNSYVSEQTTRLERLGKDDAILALRDRVDTILVLTERCDTIDDLLKQIKDIFQDFVSSNSIVFMSVHKAKGLEATRVFILSPKLMPHPSAKKEWQKTQELNLKYVALTRVKFTVECQGQLFLVN